MNVNNKLLYTSLYDSSANFVGGIFNKFGIVIRFFNPSTSEGALIEYLLKTYNIDVILDVGASVGIFGKKLATLGYHKKIYSFEPIKKSFEKLKANSSQNKNWKIFNMGLGDKAGTFKLNVSLNSDSSSLLEMHNTHIENAEVSTYVGTEEIKIERLDNIIKEENIKKSNIYLKLDVQGYEKLVLAGAVETLPMIKILQVELSLTTLYKDGPLIENMISFLREQGFELYSLVPGFKNKKTGQILQMDGFFIKK